MDDIIPGCGELLLSFADVTLSAFVRAERLPDRGANRTHDL